MTRARHLAPGFFPSVRLLDSPRYAQGGNRSFPLQCAQAHEAPPRRPSRPDRLRDPSQRPPLHGRTVRPGHRDASPVLSVNSQACETLHLFFLVSPAGQLNISSSSAFSPPHWACVSLARTDVRGHFCVPRSHSTISVCTPHCHRLRGRERPSRSHGHRLGSARLDHGWILRLERSATIASPSTRCEGTWCFMHQVPSIAACVVGREFVA